MLTDLQVSPLIGRFVGKFAVNRLLKIPPLLASGRRQPGCGKYGAAAARAVLLRRRAARRSAANAGSEMFTAKGRG